MIGLDLQAAALTALKRSLDPDCTPVQVGEVNGRPALIAAIVPDAGCAFGSFEYLHALLCDVVEMRKRPSYRDAPGCDLPVP